MSAPHTCDELASCKDLVQHSANCHRFDRSDLIVSRTAAFCALALFLILILEKA